MDRGYERGPFVGYDDLRACELSGLRNEFSWSSIMGTLRRAVVEGAMPEQRRWPIYTADIVELPSAVAGRMALADRSLPGR